MTVAELIAKLRDYDQTAIVAIEHMDADYELSDITACDVVPILNGPDNLLALATQAEIASGEAASCVRLG